ncbi:hypothetical protein BRADI_2g54441v3 [Brachypodium distachyon]|uniref:Obg domain-containing protein n=1 Tax=Brachypodium distachyon TaxID=15368 RepID=A0A2K2DFW8_BRADI|nr:hypothetical protein BRADI_2g54441v3 [Brachypodium distachyon]
MHVFPSGSGCARGGDGGNGCVSQSSQGRTAKAGLTKAGRGGHGLPKNQIGTRGSDKVAQVPDGTVIHLGSTGLHRHLAEYKRDHLLKSKMKPTSSTKFSGSNIEKDVVEW